MFGRPGTTDNRSADRHSADNRSADNRSADGPSVDPAPSMIGGWARAIGWGSLAVAGCGVVLLLVAPGELVGADPPPCEQPGNQVSCPVVPSTESAVGLPTAGSMSSQVPFAPSPNP